MPTLVEICPHAFLFAGVDFDSLLRESDLVDLLGPFDRHDDIPCHPAGFKRRMVWDKQGLVGYSDHPEDRLSHVQIAFDPDDTPGKPSAAADVEVYLNGKVLSKDITEATLPRSGPTPVVEYHHMFYFCPGSFRVDFGFQRRRNKLGKRIGVRRLAYVSFSWRHETKESVATPTSA